MDGKVRTETTYPTGFMDVIDIEKTDEHFRLVYDTKGRFVVHRISKDEAAYKLCKVRRLEFGKGGVPYVATHDGRTIRFPDPDIKVRGEPAAGRGGGTLASLYHHQNQIKIFKCGKLVIITIIIIIIVP